MLFLVNSLTAHLIFYRLISYYLLSSLSTQLTLDANTISIFILVKLSFCEASTYLLLVCLFQLIISFLFVKVKSSILKFFRLEFDFISYAIFRSIRILFASESIITFELITFDSLD